MLLDFDSEEDSRNMNNPKSAVELIGVCDWDGQGRANKYANGFLAVSHTGANYYMAANSPTERDEWVLHIKTALECNFANIDLLLYKPSKATHQLPPIVKKSTCHKTGNYFGNITPFYCKSCGNGYLPDLIIDSFPILHLGIEVHEKLCINCRNSQIVVMWLKAMNYIHAMRLHEKSPMVVQSISKFKASFKLRRLKSSRLDMAGQMLEQNLINEEEFEELRKVDEAFIRDWSLEESERLRDALEVIDDDIHTVIGMIINPTSTESNDSRSFYELIRKILQLAETSPNLIDFYWPQLLHAHTRIAKIFQISNMIKLDLLQQCILIICLKYPPLAIKACWSLLASSNDFIEKKCNASQYAANASLLLQINAVICGVAEALEETLSNSVLSSFILPALHQKIEIKVELRILMRCRRKLLYLQDEDDKLRSLSRRGSNIVEPTVGNANNSFVSTTIPNEDTSKNVNNVLRGNGAAEGRNDGDVNNTVKMNSFLKSPAKELSAIATVGLQDPMDDDRTTPYKISSDYQRGGNVSPRGSLPLDTDNTPLLLALRRLGEEEMHENEDEIGTSRVSSDRNGFAYIIAPSPLLLSRPDLSFQIDWIKSLTDIVDNLRNIERPLRTEKFREKMKMLNAYPEKLGFDPTTNAGEPRYRLTRILVEHCRVFRTKARAPSMLVCEVAREDEGGSSYALYRPFQQMQIHPSSGDENTSEMDKSVTCLDIRRATPNRRKEHGVQMTDVSTMIESGVSQAVAEIIHRRDSKDAPLPLVMDNIASSDKADRSELKGTVHSHPLPSVERGHSQDSLPTQLLSYNHDKQLIQSRSVVRTSFQPPPYHRSMSSTTAATAASRLYNKSFRLAAHKKVGSVFSSGSIHPVFGQTGSPLTYGGRMITGITLAATSSLPVLSSSPVAITDAKNTLQRLQHIAIEGKVATGGPTSLRRNAQSLTDIDKSTDLTDDTVGDSSVYEDTAELPPPASLNAGEGTGNVCELEGDGSRLSESNASPVSNDNKDETDNDKLLNGYTVSYDHGESRIDASDGVDPSIHTSKVNTISNDQVTKDPLERIHTEESNLVTMQSNSEGIDEMSYTISSNENVNNNVNDNVGTQSSIDNDNNNINDNNINSQPQQEFDDEEEEEEDDDDEAEEDDKDSITQSVLSNAKSLLESGKISFAEYELLLRGNAKFREMSAREESLVATARLQKCFGESWEDMKKRILGDSYQSFHDQHYHNYHLHHGITDTNNNIQSNNLLNNDVDLNNNNDTNNDNNQSNNQSNNLNNNNNSIVPFENENVSQINLELTSSAATAAAVDEYYHMNPNRWPLKDLKCFIIKSNDDLRQEMCCMQLLELCQEIFHDSGLSLLLWLKPYRIVATGSNTGFVQVLPDTMSIDALKKTPDFITLPKYFEKVYGTSPERLAEARRNFVTSLAAYSLVCHIFLIKDRHNGNILIDKDAHVIHIDFGFLLGIAPGGTFSLETAPFKLTDDMIEVFGGLDSPLFSEFVRGFTMGFLALQANAENIISTLDMLAYDSPFPCFLNKDRNGIIEKLRGRFRTDLNKEDSVRHCLDLITQSYGHLGTRQYDTFQWFTNGIIP